MIAVIDACGANLSSVQFALARIGAEAQLTTDQAVIKAASHVILPGVGTAGHAMKQLQDSDLVTLIPQLTQPVLGICLGMQLLFSTSAERNVACLDIISEKIIEFPAVPNLTIPHMGWNQLQFTQADSILLHEIPENSYVYFVHSYAAPVSSYTIAKTDYAMPFSAMVNFNNFYGMQFHPERSGKVGEKLLQNFLRL